MTARGRATAAIVGRVLLRTLMAVFVAHVVVRIFDAIGGIFDDTAGRIAVIVLAVASGITVLAGGDYRRHPPAPRQ